MRRLLVLVLVACRQPSSSAGIVDAGTPTTTASAATRTPECNTTTDPRAVLARWNRAHVDHDTETLASLYAPTVSFYGVSLGAGEGAGEGVQERAAERPELFWSGISVQSRTCGQGEKPEFTGLRQAVCVAPCRLVLAKER